MSYLTQALLIQDSALIQRITACAAFEQVGNPDGWVWDNRWKLSAQPDWAAAYASAKLTYEQAPEGEGIPLERMKPR